MISFISDTISFVKNPENVNPLKKSECKNKRVVYRSDVLPRVNIPSSDWSTELKIASPDQRFPAHETAPLHIMPYHRPDYRSEGGKVRT